MILNYKSAGIALFFALFLAMTSCNKEDGNKAIATTEGSIVLTSPGSSDTYSNAGGNNPLNPLKGVRMIRSKYNLPAGSIPLYEIWGDNGQTSGISIRQYLDSLSPGTYLVPIQFANGTILYKHRLLNGRIYTASPPNFSNAVNQVTLQITSHKNGLLNGSFMGKVYSSNPIDSLIITGTITNVPCFYN